MSAEELRAKIREVPDFPKPGILFYDITTLLKDPTSYKEAIDLMLAPFAGEQDRHRRRDGIAGLHLQRPDGLSARRRPRPGPQAGQAAGRDDHRRIRPRVRLEHARDPSRRDRSRAARPDRRRPAGDRRHRPRDDRARRATQGRGRRPRRSSSSSTSSRVATGWMDAASRASSSTDVRSETRDWPDPPDIPSTIPEAPLPADRLRSPDAAPAAGHGPPPVLPGLRRRGDPDRGRRWPGPPRRLQQASAEAAGIILNPAPGAAD